MTTYLYTGPLSSVTLGDGTEVLLHPGHTVQLPDKHPYVATMVALGHLSPVRSATKPQLASTMAKADTPKPTKSSAKE